MALVVDGVKYNLDVPRVKWLGQSVRDSKHMADEAIAFITAQRGSST